MALITEARTIPSQDKELDAFLARPEEDGLFPGLVIIHEAYGLKENIKHWAQRYAEAGYVALAVDLFSPGNRAICMTRIMTGMLFNALEHRGIKDLRAALDFLQTLPYVDQERMGAIGYCLGGSLAIAWACTDNRLKAIAPYYAMNPKPQEALKRLCPVVGSYPGRDFTTRPGQKLDILLDTYTVPHDIKIYPNAKHSFCNEERGNYNHEVAEDSWERVLAFFAEHI